MRWNYSSIAKLHRCSFKMDEWFLPTLYNRCNCLSMLGLKSIYVSNMGPGYRWWTTCAFVEIKFKLDPSLLQYYLSVPSHSRVLSWLQDLIQFIRLLCRIGWNCDYYLIRSYIPRHKKIASIGIILYSYIEWYTKNQSVLSTFVFHLLTYHL